MRKKIYIKRNLKRNIPLVMANGFLGSLRLYYPITILMYAAITGSYTLGMAVNSVLFISAAFFEVPTGVLSDKWGRRKTLLVATFVEMLATVCFVIALTFPAVGLPAVFAGGLCVGLATALMSGNNDALIYETLSHYRQTGQISKILGRIGSLEQLGLAISGLIATALLFMGASYKLLALFTLIPASLNLLTAAFVIEPPRRKIDVEKDSSVRHMLKAAKLIAQNPKLRLYAAATALRDGLGTASHNIMPGFVDYVWPSWAVPLYRTAQNSIGAVGFWFSNLVIKRFGPLKTLWGTNLFGSVFSLTAYMTANVFSPFILLFGTQVSYAIGFPADKTLQQINFSDAQRSTMGSLISFASSIVTGVAALIIGMIADQAGPAIALLSVFLFKFFTTNSLYALIYKNHK
ncbi:MAG: MFS transporter [Proteobacteria bacterium]|jgi:MFS family permease|nr:MFS transporter [Alphaproteobacteria bacterium]NCC03175.1 MFS transporter [Pseudomonadota bacterium]